MEHKVKFSIRLKLIVVTSTLVMASLGLYLFVALGLFNSDKSAYIFESSLNTAESVATHTQQFMGRLMKDSLNIYNLLVDRDLQPDETRFPQSCKDLQKCFAFDKYLIARIKDKNLRKTARLLDQGDLRGAERRLLLSTSIGKTADKAAALAEREDADFLYVKARYFLANHQAEEARETFEALVENFPSDRRLRRVHLALAGIYDLQRQSTKAANHYARASQGSQKIKKDPQLTAYALYRLIWVQAQMQRYDAAAKTFAQLRAMAPASIPSLLFNRLTDDTAFLFAGVKDLSPLRLGLQDAAGMVDENTWLKITGEVQRLRLAMASHQGSATALESHRLLRSLFYGDQDLVELTVYEARTEKPRPLVQLVNEEYLAEHDLKPDYLNRVDDERPVNFKQVTPQQALLMNSSLVAGMGLLTLVRQDPLTNRYLLIRFRLDRFLSMVVQNKVYNTYVVNQAGELFVHADAARMTSASSMPIELQSANGVREYKNESGEDIIAANADVGILNLSVISEIKRSKAFLAARELTIRSIYFGIFFIALAIFIGVLFARTLTNPIDRLFKGTRVIAAGDFKTRVEVDANDEIGVLSDSFNFMAGRIVQLLEQEKEKVRMEGELKVAKLVQDSFFPATHQLVGGLEISSFYTPSSECGGDWWGCVKSGDKTLILIGDATGHGVPAALLTATAASCTSTIEALAGPLPELLNSPAHILGLLNRAVFNAAQGKILMTFFACVIDTRRQAITYSNASHNPPYLYKYQEHDPDRKDLQPLLESVGLRLGHQIDASYKDTTTSIAAGDSLVLFTDGIVECTNAEKAEYGGRKFIKSILRNAKSSSEAMRDGIIKDAMEFYAGEPFADDLTMVCVKVLPLAESHVAA